MNNNEFNNMNQVDYNAVPNPNGNPVNYNAVPNTNVNTVENVAPVNYNAVPNTNVNPVEPNYNQVITDMNPVNPTVDPAYNNMNYFDPNANQVVVPVDEAPAVVQNTSNSYDEEGEKKSNGLVPIIVLVSLLVVGFFVVLVTEGEPVTTNTNTKPSTEKTVKDTTTTTDKDNTKETELATTKDSKTETESIDNTTNQETQTPTDVSSQETPSNLETIPITEEIEEISGLVIYLYAMEEYSIETDGIKFLYKSFQSNVLNVDVSINGYTQNYNIPLEQEMKITGIKNPIFVEKQDDQFLIQFR